AFVHHALADRRTKSGFFNDLEHFSGVVDSLHRERARSAAFNQLRNTETRRSCDRSSRVGRLHGPNALLQPVDKCEIICRAAKECLAKVNVSLDETRNYRAVASVDYNVGCLARTADFSYAFVTNEKIAAHDGVRMIHRNERAVLDED